jgi:hypothetical protein
MNYNTFYSLFVPAQAVGANLVYFDLFNAQGSGKSVFVHSVVPVVSGAVAVTGALAVDLFLTKTSAVGTGGTAATTEGTSLTAATISAIDNSQPIDANITARLTPSGGATAAGVLAHRSVFTEETNAGTYIQANDMVRGLYTDVAPLKLPQGKGIRVVQGSVASVGNIGFNVIFRIAQNGA